jgi:hypothetical protein
VGTHARHMVSRIREEERLKPPEYLENLPIFDETEEMDKWKKWKKWNGW